MSTICPDIQQGLDCREKMGCEIILVSPLGWHTHMAEWCDVEVISKSTHHKTPVWRLLCRGLPAANCHIRHRDTIMQGQNYVVKHCLRRMSELVLKEIWMMNHSAEWNEQNDVLWGSTRLKWLITWLDLQWQKTFEAQSENDASEKVLSLLTQHTS